MASNKSVDEWTAQFNEFDKDSSGSLSILELRDLMRSNDSKMPDSQIAERFVAFEGPSGDQRITLDEFTSGMTALQEKIEEVKALYKYLDKDDSGSVSKTELVPLAKALYKDMSDDDLTTLFDDADTSDDGKITLEEFLRSCT